MTNSMDIATAGLLASGRKFGDAANDVVTASVVPASADFVAPRRANNLPSAFVDMKLTEQSYKASLVVLLAAQEMSAELLERED